jgi:hypothetical protein
LEMRQVWETYLPRLERGGQRLTSAKQTLPKLTNHFLARSKIKNFELAKQ